MYPQRLIFWFVNGVARNAILNTTHEVTQCVGGKTQALIV